MASGVPRSKWLSPLAKSLGLAPQRLRDLFNRNGYQSPYLDEIRGLKICVDHKLDIRAYLDKAGHPPDFLASLSKPTRPPGAPVAPIQATELVLAQSPAPPPPRQPDDERFPVPISSDPLIVRLAKLLGGTGPEYQKQARAILAEGGMDGRSYKAEAKCLQLFVSKGIDVRNFERRDPNHPLEVVGRSISGMAITELRQFAEELQGDNASKAVLISSLETRLNRVAGLLESAKRMIIQEYRTQSRGDETEPESMLRLALAECIRKL